MTKLVRLVSILLVTGNLANCAGYVPGAKANWDARVEELCAKDGGVIVFEHVHLTRDQYKRMGGFAGSISIPTEERASPESLYIRRSIETRLNESPSVVRFETQIVRQSDGKLLGRSIRYSRRGGDLPTGLAHDSYFACPEHVDPTKQIFIVEGGAQ